MSNKKLSQKEVAISRVTIMLFSLAFLSLLSYLYILPFKKHMLQVNNYYSAIEYTVMGVTFAAFICAFIYFVLKRKDDYSQKLITPAYYLILSSCAFSFALIIPLSSNRTLFSKYAVAVYLCVFIVYAVYFLVSRSLAYPAFAASVYCILFSFADVYFSGNLTFNDVPMVTYSTYLLIFAGILVLFELIAYFISRKNSSAKLWHTSVLSLTSAVGILVRIFVLKYVSLISIITIAAVFLAISVFEKVKEKKAH